MNYRLLPFVLLLFLANAQSEVEIQTALIQQGRTVPGERVQLEITVATKHWFSGGPRIHLPEVEGLIIVQTNAFASNASEVRDSGQWTLQRWYLDIYAQRAGVFSIPPLEVSVQTGSDQGVTPRQRLNTDAQKLSVIEPPNAPSNKNWIASSQFSISDQFDRDPSTARAGDAIVRTIILSATDILPMMLPSISRQITGHTAVQQGLDSYRSTPVLQQESNRGTLLAQRIETISYILKQDGHYQLPEQHFYWWNTRTKQFEQAHLPAVNIGSSGVNTEATQNTAAVLWRVAIATLLLTLILWHWYRRPHLIVQRQINRCLRQQNASDAIALLYQWLDTCNNKKQLRQAFAEQPDKNRRAVDQLLVARYRQSTPLPRHIKLPKPIACHQKKWLFCCLDKKVSAAALPPHMRLNNTFSREN